MRTTKPISTISYNSTEFLLGKLDELTNAGMVEFWFIVVHRGEDDEAGKKDHTHVFVVPAKMVQTEDFREALIEPVPGGKPLGCLAWRSSKQTDAILYFLHDKNYLRAKGLQRKFSYTTSDVLTSDPDDFMRRYYEAMESTEARAYAQIIEACERGLSFGEFLKLGIVPIQQVIPWRAAYQELDAIINPDKYKDDDGPRTARKRP